MARIYSPVSGDFNYDAHSRYYGGTDSDGETIDRVTADEDIREFNYNINPFAIESKGAPRKMAEGTVMVPRVLKTNVGDIFTTNMIKEKTLALGDILSPGATDGILAKAGDGSMQWQVVKLYTLPDHQKAVKIMRIA